MMRSKPRIEHADGSLHHRGSIGLFPGYIAHTKGRSFGLWWLYGALIFIVALPHALVMKPDEEALEREALNSGQKKCPACAEMIKREARVCRYCGKEQPI